MKAFICILLLWSSLAQSSRTPRIEGPSSLVPDGAGGIYIDSPRQNQIFRVTENGAISLAVGDSRYWFSGDGGPARSAQLASPEGITRDAKGNLYIADTWNHRIRKVSAEGIITTVAGNGISDFGGDGGPATSAQLFSPETVAVDGAGNLFIAESGNNRIRKVSPEGVITTMAGNGTSGFNGDGGPATSAQLAFPRTVVVDAAGNLFIAGSGSRIRKVNREGIITTAAGNGTSGFSGDGGPAASAQFSTATGMAVDAAGNLLIADTQNHRIRKVSRDGIITTVAGNGTSGFSGDGGPATSAQLNRPQAVAADAAGTLFIIDSGNRIRKVTPGGVITTIVGN